jgi:hypothetical protein
MLEFATYSQIHPHQPFTIRPFLGTALDNMNFNILSRHVVPRSGCSRHELDLRLRMSSTTTFSLFATLPVEICLDIFRLFCHHCQDPTMQYDYHGYEEVGELESNISSLCSLSLTCKGFQALLSPSCITISRCRHSSGRLRAFTSSPAR